MCNPALVLAGAAVVTAAGTVYSGMAQNSQSKYAEKVNNQNAELERRASRDAIERSQVEQMRHYRRLAQARGEARVRNAGAGLDTSFGSAANLEDDITMIGWEDSQTIAENARREAMGYDINAANYVMEGRAARSRGRAAQTGSFISAAGTLLGGAAQFGESNVRANRSPWSFG